jgi:hypothetical protein
MKWDGDFIRNNLKAMGDSIAKRIGKVSQYLGGGQIMGCNGILNSLPTFESGRDQALNYEHMKIISNMDHLPPQK